MVPFFNVDYYFKKENDAKPSKDEYWYSPLPFIIASSLYRPSSPETFL
jgi:hypothetical protein